jgi:hypothetical protein
MRPAFMPRAKHRCELLRHIAGQRGLRRHASCRKAAARPNTLTLSVPLGYPAAPRTSQGLRPRLRCFASEGRSPPQGGRGSHFLWRHDAARSQSCSGNQHERAGFASLSDVRVRLRRIPQRIPGDLNCTE